MSDVSVLHMNPAPVPQNGFRSIVSGSQDPAISVDVGMVLTPDPSSVFTGKVFFAQADSLDNAQAVGLAYSATEANKPVTVQGSGPMTWPTERWDRVTGESGGLTAGAVYYLSDTTPGMLTQTPGTVTARIGLALTKTTLLINIQTPFVTSP